VADRWKTERRYGGKLVENRTQAIMSPSSEPRWDHCPGFASMVGKAVEVEGVRFTVSYEIQTKGGVALCVRGVPASCSKHRAALHFVRFKDDRYLNAVKAFGRPDFIHRHYDHRAVAEVMPGDTVIFAEGDSSQPVVPFSYDDSAFF
jgi:hypothetical protein